MYGLYAKLPTFAEDFLGNEIKVDDLVAYPTGGTSCRLVLGRVWKIMDFTDSFKWVQDEPYQRYTGRYENGPVYVDDIQSGWRHRGYGYKGGDGNGFRGPIVFKLGVERLLDGSRGADSGKTTIEQLHRVMRITDLNPNVEKLLDIASKGSK
jgi:hypothetical protein